jgi:hypothetical protein
VGGRRGRFSTVEKRGSGRGRGGAQSASVWGVDGATAQAECLPAVSGGTDLLVRGGCDPIFACRGTAMGPPNSHFETWRRTQTVRDFPKRTVSEAYPCTTYTCLDPCTHRNGCVWNLSNESRPMRRPWGRRFEMRHDGSTQAPSDSYRGPGVTLVQQTHPSYACMQALSGRGS